MPAYLLALVDEVLDPAGLEQYVQQVIPIMAKFGGRYTVTSFAVEALEGNTSAQGAAVAEFPSLDAARGFWNSDEYAPLKEVRKRSVRVKILLADVPASA